MTQAEALIPTVLQFGGDLTPTRIAKLLYLIDLGWVQLNGASLTKLPYVWHKHGPYCPEIEEALWGLEDEGAIREQSFSGKEYTIYSLAERPTSQVGSDVERVVRFVVKRFGRMQFKDFIDYVYATPPMAEVQKNGSRFDRLQMAHLGEDRKLTKDEVLSVMDQIERAQDGETICARAALEQLGAE